MTVLKPGGQECKHVNVTRDCQHWVNDNEVKVNKQGGCLFTFLQQQAVSIWIKEQVEFLHMIWNR